MIRKKQNREPFANLVEKPKRTKKWLLFPLSLVLHAVVIAAVIVVPLLSVDDVERMPSIKVIDAFLLTPQPPPPPAPPKGSKGKKGNKTARQSKKKTNKPGTVNTGRIVEPVVIPSEIEEEDIGMYWQGDGDGIEGAPILPDGFDEEHPGVAIFGDDTKNVRTPITIVRMPKLIRRVKPVYPKMARDARIQGPVTIKAVTDIYGKVVKTTVLSGNPLLKQAAVDAIKQWRYEPYILNGMPKPVTFTVTIHFTLKR